MNRLPGRDAARVGIVNDGELPVAGEAHVNFDAVGFKFRREADGGEGVFRGAGRSAAMSENFQWSYFSFFLIVAGIGADPNLPFSRVT